MKKRHRIFSLLASVTFLFSSITYNFYSNSYAMDESNSVNLANIDISELEEINEDYNLNLSDEELRQESAVLGGARIEGNRAYEIPLMQQAQMELAQLSEDRAIDLPAGIYKENPQQFFYIGSIGVRIELLRKVNHFINQMTTEYIYKIQEAHNLASQVCFEAVMVAINPFNGRKDVLTAIDKLDKNIDKITSMRDMTSGDLATFYVKKLMYKNIREARKAQNNFFDQDRYGTRGKEEYIQNIYKGEVNDINKQVGQKITFGQLLELDARLKSATSSALLSNEVTANSKWINETVNKEINKQNRLKGKYRNQISKEDYDIWQNLLRKLIDRKIERNPSYDKITEAVYDLWDFNAELMNKYPQSFSGDVFGDFIFERPSSYIEPHQVAGIKWIVQPTFDKIPAGMQASGSSIIIGFGGQKAQYGDYTSYVNQRSALRDEIVTTSMDGNNPDYIYPDFTNPGY